MGKNVLTHAIFVSIFKWVITKWRQSINYGQYKNFKVENEAKLVESPKLKEKKIHNHEYSTKLLIFRLLTLHF